jgi:nucleoside-diphosphate-sugar epimerase
MSDAERNRAILVTGASGYLGYAAALSLAEAGHRVRFGARAPAQACDMSHEWVFYGDLAEPSGLDGVLSRAAERARQVNVEGTGRLAEAAVRGGVRRFVFISSAHVNGPSSRARPFREDDPPQPDNVYARSKLDAELRLKDIAGASAMEWVIVRPPMVYGPRAPGNFQRLVSLMRTGLPVPLGAARAPKSFLYVGNLTSAINAIARHPAAANKTFLVSDSEMTSTAGLLRLIADALGKRALLVNVPEAPLALGARMIGGEKDIRRLFDPLEIDSGLIRTTLQWSPPVALAEAVRRSVARG